MQKRTFKKTGEKISLLGMGVMRLPETADGLIDEDLSVDMIRRAIEGGINYMDCAYTYHGGASEKVLGKALKNGYREKVFIADKIPAWLAKNEEDIEKMFEESLARLDVDFIDMYLIHNITAPIWKKVQKLNVIPFLEQKQREGKIRHLGFSFHDSLSLFREVVDFRSWDFCQIQLNYMDADIQAGVAGLRYAASKGLSVIIMEPLKGGRLTDAVPSSIKKIWDRAETKRSPPEWCFRWVADFPQVTTILSGMSTMDQLEENLAIIENCLPESLTKNELSLIEEAAGKYRELIKYQCTDCKYCMPCPFKVDIPRCLSLYNEWFLYDKNPKTLMEYKSWMDKRQRASNCTDCKECESKCPQQLHITEAMKKIKQEFGE